MHIVHSNHITSYRIKTNEVENQKKKLCQHIRDKSRIKLAMEKDQEKKSSEHQKKKLRFIWAFAKFV